MSHFPRFRRRKGDATQVPVMAPAESHLPGKTTPPPADLPPPVPIRRGPKLSTLHHVFHRSSGKRSRDSPPSELPNLPTTAVVAHDGVPDHGVSPMAPCGDAPETERPRMPAFLELSQHEIDAKFLDLIWHERDRLQQAIQNPSPDFRWAKVSGPYTRVLDRYVNIQPWNNNRVRLQVPKGHVDYINASPIVLQQSHQLAAIEGRPRGQTAVGHGRDRYIAMQGPKQQSTDHVWRMVVEQLEGPGVIVMLTETVENGHEKCWPYFPSSKEDPPLEVNAHDEFGDGFHATVHCEGLEETPAGDAIELRKLVIRVHARCAASASGLAVDQDGNGQLRPNGERNGAVTPDRSLNATHNGDTAAQLKSPTADIREGIARLGSVSGATTPTSNPVVEERVVWHFLYKKWPDFGVPALDDVESFFTLMRLSREKNANPQNPRIVHCSAGVGRSGTFIALEHLMRELDAGALEHYDELALGPGSTNQGDETTAPGSTTGPEDKDLVFETVNQLREQRRTMVQAEAQYRFIYQVMRKLWRDKYGEEEGAEPAAKRLEVDPFVEG